MEEREQRKLATLQVIDSLSPIEGADRIEVAKVLGWNVVVKKGDFKVGDQCVFFEVDSVLPFASWSEFLRDKNRPDKPIRLKTIRLRGQLSQGLALPLKDLPVQWYFHDGSGKLVPNFPVGTDLTERLGVIKYEPVIPAQLAGIQKGNFPGFIPKTDELRIQSYPRVIEEFKGKEVVATIKMDGTSFTCYRRGEQFGVCSRNLELVEDVSNTYWKIAHEHELREKLEQADVNFAIQGEICGPGIQKNKMGLDKLTLFVFNIYDIDEGAYLDDALLPMWANTFGFELVPTVCVDYWQWDTVDELLEWTNNLNYANHTDEHDSPAEGVVIRPCVETYSDVLRGRLSIKVISNRFLEKYKE